MSGAEGRALRGRGGSRLRRLAAVAAIVLAVTVATGACVPSEPYAPIAVLAEGSEVQVWQTSCPRQPVDRLRVIPLRITKDRLLDVDAPALWQVSFAEPT